MTQVLAFDVYGTLIDTYGVVTRLRSVVGDAADLFASRWRDKQLEYSFRRGLMHCYEDFSVCIRDALDFTAASLQIALSATARESLLAAYRELPAFPDALPALEALSGQRCELYAFSNGAAATVDTLLTGAGIRRYFRDIVSVEECRSFKPNPMVYRHFLARAGAAPGDAWLVSGNPFDVIGAINTGMRGIWVQRSATHVFDPWGTEPDRVVSSLAELGAVLTH